MIISGGSRSNWRFFAKHLTNTRDNERVTLIEIRGLAADNVREALREMDALASGTQCKNFFYHADINPREQEQLTPDQWERAVDSLEKNLGLEGHSRFVIEHQKQGRTHRHVLWSRIDVESMTAVSDSHNYAAHERTARALEREFEQDAVPGVHGRETHEKRPKRRPKNWETFRGKKSGVDPQAVKAEVTALWQKSDSGRAFAAALEENGYVLCQGDRRDFCLIDPAAQEHSLARRIEGAKAAEIRARLADIDRDALPTVAAARGNNTSSRARLHQKTKAVALENYARPLIEAVEHTGHVNEVRQDGAGSSWWERAQVAFTRWREDAREFWKEKIDSWRERTETRRKERERDEPELLH